jgi:hypothetical protein
MALPISCLESFGKFGADGWPLIHIITIVHHSFTSSSSFSLGWASLVCLRLRRLSAAFTRGDHLMWMMARSSLPAYLMFIIYTHQTLSFVPPYSLCPLLLKHINYKKKRKERRKKNQIRGEKWKMEDSPLFLFIKTQGRCRVHRSRMIFTWTTHGGWTGYLLVSFPNIWLKALQVKLIHDYTYEKNLWK